MKYVALLLGLLMMACNGPAPETSTPPGATVYRQGGGGALLACKPVGFDTICRGG
jgi:hypothetical protein